MSFISFVSLLPLNMERLLHHVDIITRQRNRGQLETSVVEAARELLGAESARLYKLFTPPGDLMVGLAAEATSTTTRMLDDGISWPHGTGSIQRQPHLHACVANHAPCIDREPESGLMRSAFPIPSVGQDLFGFLVLTRDRPFSDDDRVLAQGLIALFRNCVALLDYSEIDTLTGLLNRKTFDEYLINILSHVANDGDMAAGSPHLPRRRAAPRGANHHWLGVMDIDHFKQINDKFGHLIGDEVLILVANLMKQTFRAQDKLFRFGGEEFVVLLKPMSADNATATFERYRKEVEAYVFPQVGAVTVSVGFTRINLFDTPSMILDNADEALYYAKEHGRNGVYCYEDLIERDLLQKQQVLNTEVELF